MNKVATAQPIDLKKYSILFVDDNPIDVLIYHLRECGFSIKVTQTGERGLEIAKTSHPDLILLDVMMPGINGFETCRQLKANESTADIPIIFMTALESLEDKIKGFEVGGVDYITKPMQPEELIARITTHLRIQDLTAHLNANIEELTRTRQELVQSEKMASLGRLVAGFAHEINTPVGVAVGAISSLQENTQNIHQLLEQEEVDEDELVDSLENVNEAANITMSNLKRAANLIRNFKRAAVDQATENIVQFQVKSVIKNVINKFEQASIKLECPESLAIYSVPDTLEQILNHLIMNSLIHGFDNDAGEINIAVTLMEDNLHLEYSDTGKGIAPENLEKIFEPFFTTSRAHGGSGLGLYICYNLVTTQLKGSMNCDSTPNNGVMFQIGFPVTF